MDRQQPILDRKSKIFFIIFFAAILLSVAATYYNIEILHNFHAFTADEPIPDPVEEYQELFGVVLHWLHLM